MPNYVAHASQFTPNDPDLKRQWNFTGPYGIGMPEAWALAADAGAPGGRGATVAVLDSGVAFERYGGFRRAPDLRRSTFVHPWDFVDHDRHPNDRYGHGTHVTGTIAQTTNNGLGVAGAAYGVKIMPLKVLNDFGEGDSLAIARAIRYAAKHGAEVINLSLEFDRRVVASEIPEILAAIRYAHGRGAVIVAAAGNTGQKSLRRVAYPARASDVIAVGATTQERLPLGVLELRPRPRRRRARRRCRRRGRRPRGGGALPPRVRRRVDLPGDLHRQQRAPVRAAGRLRGHLDGQPPRGRASRR